MFQEIFGNETLAGLKLNLLDASSKNVENPSRFGEDPNSGIEMQQWVYQCAYEKATAIVERSDIDERYYII